MLTEFKKFAMRGNVLDLAVGVVIGAAFGKIVSSLVDDLMMPLVGVLIGGVNFQKLSFSFYDAEVKYGAFIQSVVDFTIIAFSIFLFIRLINRFTAKNEVSEEEVVEVDQTEALLTEIRDLLKERQH